MRVLVLGGYGFIGLAACRALMSAGHDVVGAGRAPDRGRAAAPEACWVRLDVAELTSPDDWRTHLEGVDVVVNAAGVLQRGGRDRPEAVREGLLALVEACSQRGVSRFVQISAAGAEIDSPIAFMSDKAKVDEALGESGLEWTVLRPGLVIGPSAYGGTSLLRMLAAFPVVVMLAAPAARVQTVALDDVARAVVLAAEGGLARRSVDLLEDAPHTLREIVLAFRVWLGFAPPRAVIVAPAFLSSILARGADAAGALGWRPALRSTALRVLAAGVVGDPSGWRAAQGFRLKTLSQTLAALPSTAQERVYARVQLAFPALLIVLAAFWLASGAIGLARLDAATAHLAPRLEPGVARSLAVIGGLVDLGVGVGLLFKRTLRWACVAAVAVSIVYLIGGSILAPALWGDPLGPLVKVFPVIALALGVLAAAPER